MPALHTLRRALRYRWKLAIAACVVFSCAAYLPTLRLLRHARPASISRPTRAAAAAEENESSRAPAPRDEAAAASLAMTTYLQQLQQQRAALQRKLDRERQDGEIQGHETQDRNSPNGKLPGHGLARNKLPSHELPNRETEDRAPPAQPPLAVDAPPAKEQPPRPSTALLLLRPQLAAAQEQLRQLRLVYTDRYPEVLDARDRVDELQRKLASAPQAPEPAPPSAPPADSAASPTPAQTSAPADAPSNQAALRVLAQDKAALADLAARSSAWRLRLHALSAAPIAAPLIRVANPAPATALATHLGAAGPPPQAPTHSRLAAAAVSLLLGSFLAAALVFLREQNAGFVTDEHTLRALLPAGVECIGRIPRMRPE